MLTLRPYQMDALEALEDYLREERGTSPIICAPTGSGKGLLIAELIRRVCVSNKDAKIICCTHSRELVAQNSSELKSLWKEANVGIYSAGLNKRQTKAQIIFCGIQSVYKKAFSFGHIDLIIIDEAHAISRNAQSMYGKFLSDIHISSPNAILVGMTATPYRLSDGLLHVGDDRIFDGIAYVCDLKRLINEGYLVPVISKGGCDLAKIDLTNVHIRAGEYSPAELAHASDSKELVRLAVEEVVQCGADRKAWLVFCSGVNHALHVAEEIKKHGIEAEVVTGETPKEERDRIISNFKNGKLRCVVNVGVMTTGVNIPRCDLIALLTATTSAGRYVQMVGRCLRTSPGKQDALLLDYGGNCARFGMLDDIDPIRTRNIFNVVEKAEPVKECPNCHVILHARLMQCPACDFVFQSVSNHGTTAYDGAVLKSQQEPFIVEVKEMYCTRHKKPGKPDSVKVAFYDAEDREFALWACLDHDGFAKEKAEQVVKTLGGKATTVAEAMKEWSYWKKVTHVKVKPEGKFYRIEGFVFGEQVITRQTCLVAEGETT